jgi:hypothetical protein
MQPPTASDGTSAQRAYLRPSCQLNVQFTNHAALTKNVNRIAYCTMNTPMAANKA